MTLRTAIILDLKGNLETQARQSGRAIEQLGRGGARSMTLLSRASNLAGRALDTLGNKYAALVTGAGAAATTRFLIQLEERFTQLGVQAGKSAEEVEKLKREIFATARAPGIRIDPGELTAAAEELTQRLGQRGLDIFAASRKTIAQGIGGGFARGADIGALAAEIAQKQKISEPEDVAKALAIIVSQGKEGAFILKEFATQGTRLFSAFSRAERTGVEPVRELSAIAQVARMGSANAEMAATAFEGLFRVLNDAQKRKLISRLGIRIIDPDEPTRMRNVVEILKDIIKATEGDQVKLGKIFDAEPIRAVLAAVADFNDPESLGDFSNTFDKFMGVVADANALQEDAARASNTMAGAMRSLTASYQDFADRNLSGPIKEVADAINSLKPGQIDALFGVLTGLGIAAGGLFIGRQLGLGALLRRGKRGGAAGAAGIGGIGSLAPQPVIVMNWPMGMMGRGAASPIFAGGPGGRTARRGLLRDTRGSMRATGAIGLGLGALGLAAILNDQSASPLEKFRGGGSFVGSFGGFAGGAKLGALAGAFVGPIGVAIGGLLGGAAGALIGSNIGDAAGEALGRALGHRDRAEVAVAFENAPPGMRVRRVDSSRGLSVTTDMLFPNRGPQMVTQP